MQRRFATLAAAAAALSSQAALAVPTAVFTDGRLTGVRNLETSVGTFDVDWEVGTCADVYGNDLCTTVGNPFGFDQAGAQAAATALDDFLATQDESLLPGYNPATGNSLTFVATPYAIVPYELRIGPTVRRDGESISVYLTSGLTRDDYVWGGSVRTKPGSSGRSTFATYTPSVVPPSAVPEPATWLMMGLGLAVVGVAGRRRLAGPDETRRAR
ncbi:PEP-CTERM sorting domain-containing protein [Pseudaquabacterium rugosum]|uniref:PEP-CTERM sorting domain-containing protein n=1 Tax=Pseudaquabacterium rugosum TaxID=2984194 RepID=A0ABU9B8L1_9BURK